MLAIAAALLMQIATLPPAQAEEQLVAWAVSDFEANLPGPAAGFRNVSIGALQHPEGVSRPIICGDVAVAQADGTGEWVPFATLETRGGYEQYLGGSAAGWCTGTAKGKPRPDVAAHLTQVLVDKRGK